jgi:hypothetical protein
MKLILTNDLYPGFAEFETAEGDLYKGTRVGFCAEGVANRFNVSVTAKQIEVTVRQCGIAARFCRGFVKVAIVYAKGGGAHVYFSDGKYDREYIPRRRAEALRLVGITDGEYYVRIREVN